VQRLKESVPETPSQNRANNDRTGDGQDELNHRIRLETHRANKKSHPQEETHRSTTSSPNDSVLAIWRCHSRGV
jgi:hypothetical protein